MKIAYASRSKFLSAFESAIQEHCTGLRAGGVVRVDLAESGYDGRVIVTIDPTDCMFFGTDWERTDPSRFPARIKAAATALRNCRCQGRFEISHSDGSLTIRAV